MHKNVKPVSKGTITTVVLAVGAVLAFGWAWQRAVVHTPLLAMPDVVVPAHNAYDPYRRAEAHIVDATTLAYATSRARRNGAPFTGSKLLERNAEAVALVREGLRLQYGEPPRHSAFELSTGFKLPSLARLLALDAGVHLERKEWAAAADAKLDQVEFAQSLIVGAGIEGLTCALTYRYYCTPNWNARSSPNAGTTWIAPLIDKLSPPQLDAVAARLRGIIARRRPFGAVLADEKWTQLRARDQILSQSDWTDAYIGGGSGGAGASARMAQLGRQAQWMGMDKRRVLLDYSRFMDGCIALNRASAGSSPAFPPPPADPMNQQLVADLAGARRLYDLAARGDAEVLVRIALRLYFLEHGHYPSSWREICPRYLARLPDEVVSGPYAVTYSSNGGSYTLGETMASPPRPPSRYPFAGSANLPE